MVFIQPPMFGGDEGYLEMRINEDPLASYIEGANDWPFVVLGPDYVAEVFYNEASFRIRLGAKALLKKYKINGRPTRIKLIRLQHESIPRVRVYYVEVTEE